MRTTMIALTFVALTSMMYGQPRFEIPIAVTSGGSATEILHFGFFPGAHYCFHQADTMNGNGECDALPLPPAGVFYSRLTLPRNSTGDSCCTFIGGSLWDYRPFTSDTQKDTFKIRGSLGGGSTWMLSWPPGLASRFTQLMLRFFDQVQGRNINIDMLTTTSVDATPAGDPLTVYIFSGGLVVTSVQPILPGVPGKITLVQNYPNPFNPETNITFQIPSSSFVSLKVFDVLGGEVATIVSEWLTPGTYERLFTAEGLTSGVYFYRLQAGGSVQTKKLLLLR